MTKMVVGKPRSLLGGSASCHGPLGAPYREIWSSKSGKVTVETDHNRPVRDLGII